MVTTVTVDDETRRRLKRLAAALDETQGDIVRRAIALYESRMRSHSVQRKVPRRIAKELEKASATIRKNDPKWARISKMIEDAQVPMDDFSPAKWGKEI